MAASSTPPATLRAASLAFFVLVATLAIPVAFAASAPPADADGSRPMPSPRPTPGGSSGPWSR
ncbi:MAG: hypothetical protein IPG84_15365 [Betaproteobacteria bacterium]|nr:hypothetical protein [Betaproteobacteria bacterium]